MFNISCLTLYVVYFFIFFKLLIYMNVYERVFSVNFLFVVFSFLLVLFFLCLVAQSCPTLRPHGLQPIRLLCPWGFSRKKNWSGLPCPPPGDLPNPGMESRSPTLQVDSLPTEPPGKPKDTGVDSLSLLQGVFLTRYLNQGLLHCRQYRF